MLSCAFKSIPVFAYSIDEELAGFNERGNWCEVYNPIDTALYIYGSATILGALLLVFQMRKVREQLNEHRLQVTFKLLRGHCLAGSIENVSCA